MGSTRLAEQSGRRQKIEPKSLLHVVLAIQLPLHGHKFKAVCFYECSSCAVLEEGIPYINQDELNGNG